MMINKCLRNQSLEMDAKKKSHTSSELSTIKSYLFRGRLTDPLLCMNGEQKPNPAAGRERENMHFTSAFIV